jgi:HK97 family phage major capsid protein
MIKHVLCVPGSVLAVLALGVPGNAILFNDVDAVIEAHRTRQGELADAQATIVATADAESRELSVEEGQQLDELAAEFDRLGNEIDRRERLINQTSLLTQSSGRQTEADPVADDGPVVTNAAPPNAPRAAAPSRAPAQPRVSAGGNFGFRNMGEFARTVRAAHPSFGGNVDQRLIRAAAASTYASEGTGADGGFLVPPDFRTEVLSRVFGEDSLIQRTRRIQSSSNSITMPIDTTSPWGSTGVQSYWTAEGATKTQSKPAFENVTVKAHTLATLVPVTEELLEDAPALDGYLRMAVPKQMDFVISNALIRGSGAGQPLGILNAGGLVTVAAEGAQSADTILAANIFKMYARMPVSSRQTAVWLIHPDAEPQLYGLTLANQPVFLPAGGLSDAPFGRLMGRPVIPHQVTETVGDLGDIMFVDFNEYISLTKTGNGRDANGMKSDVSIHLWFDQDLVAYRFTIRVGGQPIWNSTLAQRDGTSVQSPYVALAAR